MGIIRHVIILGVFASIFLSCRSEKQSIITVESPKKLLILTETQGYRHTSIEAGVAMFNKHATDWGVDITSTADSKDLVTSSIKGFDVIVLLNTTGDYLDAEEEAALKDYVSTGGSILGVHAATDAEYEWDWYGYMLGGWFDSHPEIQEGKCEVVDNAHVLTSGLPAVWTRTDEWYNFKNLLPDNNVTVTIDENSYTGGTHGASHPISWYRTIEKGRVFYTAMGHTEASYSEPLFIQQIQNALVWLTEEK